MVMVLKISQLRDPLTQERRPQAKVAVCQNSSALEPKIGKNRAKAEIQKSTHLEH
jgi:hypothetical protein